MAEFQGEAQHQHHRQAVEKTLEDDGGQGGAGGYVLLLPVQVGPMNSPRRAGRTLFIMKPMSNVGNRLLKRHFLTGPRGRPNAIRDVIAEEIDDEGGEQPDEIVLLQIERRRPQSKSIR
jgi:hypothetical protein